MVRKCPKFLIKLLDAMRLMKGQRKLLGRCEHASGRRQQVEVEQTFHSTSCIILCGVCCSNRCTVEAPKWFLHLLGWWWMPFPLVTQRRNVTKVFILSPIILGFFFLLNQNETKSSTKQSASPPCLPPLDRHLSHLAVQ